MSDDLLTAALDYAANGLPVFPCHHGTKRPLTGDGFKNATTDAETIRAWWQQHPRAMIGIPTGQRSGFWALDIDDPAEFEAACKLDIPATRRSDTGKGYHLLFRFDPDMPVANKQRHATKGWPFPEMPGAETRGEGGYIIAPPSIHPNGKRYQWHDDTPMAVAPAALVDAVTRKATKPPKATAKPADPVPSKAIATHTAYGQAALDGECAAIRAAGDGQQEKTLNDAALKIGGLIAGGEIEHGLARAALVDAANAMPSFDSGQPWTGHEVADKIDRGLRDGARQPRSAPDTGKAGDGVRLDDFRAYMPMHNYIFAPSGEFWPAASVNSRLPRIPLVNADGSPALDKKGEQIEQQPAAWLDANRAVEMVTWIPGKPQVIGDKLVKDGGWHDRKGCNTFNLYRPPAELQGDAGKAAPWLDHVRRVYPGEAEHLIQWLAQRVQRPWEKINHAIVMGGAQGIGKDTILEPVKAAIGAWNFTEVSPQQMLGRFNGFTKSVILRVSEARDLGDTDRFAFYDHMKTYTAAPPDVLRVDEKHLREYSVFNVCGVIITTNHKSDGIHLEADDRRHFVAWSDLTRDSFEPDYWTRLYRWFANGGTGHVATYLRTLDLAAFNPKAPPEKTAAFWEIVSSNMNPEDSEMADTLDTLGRPAAVTIATLASVAPPSFAEYLTDRRNARRIPHRFEQCGYVPVHNEGANDGLFKIGGRRQRVYARKELERRDQFAAATKLGSR